MDTYYKIDWQALKIVPVTLNKDGLDSENYPFDRDAHYTTENEAIMYMKAICRKRVLDAGKRLNDALNESQECEATYEAAIKQNAQCLERYSFADTHIE